MKTDEEKNDAEGWKKRNNDRKTGHEKLDTPEARKERAIEIYKASNSGKSLNGRKPDKRKISESAPEPKKGQKSKKQKGKKQAEVMEPPSSDDEF